MGDDEFPLGRFGLLVREAIRLQESLRESSLPRTVPGGTTPRAFDDALWTYADIAPGLVLNRPTSMRPNTSKPLQEAIRRAGFKVRERSSRRASMPFGSSRARTIDSSTNPSVGSARRPWLPRRSASPRGRPPLVPRPNSRSTWTEPSSACTSLAPRSSTKDASPWTDYRYRPAEYSPPRCLTLSPWPAAANELGLTLAGST